MGSSLAAIHARFSKLYKRRFYLHHYEEYMDVGEISESAQSVADLVQEYNSLHAREEAPLSVLRPQPLGLSFC
jgi:tubulin epsilon